MDDAARLALIMGASVMVNTVSAVQRGKDAVVPMVAGGITFVGLALFGGLTNKYGLSNAIAMVFFIASLVFRGLPIIQKSNLLGSTGGGKAGTGTTGTSADGYSGVGVNPSGSTANSTADGNTTRSGSGVGM